MSAKAPSTEPTTIPAICPPVRPRRVLVPAATMPVLNGEDVPVPVGVAVIVTGCSDEDATIGRLTPTHRVVVFEKTQQESVALGELAPQ